MYGRAWLIKTWVKRLILKFYHFDYETANELYFTFFLHIKESSSDTTRFPCIGGTLIIIINGRSVNDS